jgi:hypothetical protein
VAVRPEQPVPGAGSAPAIAAGARHRQEADMAEDPDETEAGEPVEGDEARRDDRSGAGRSDGGIDPVTASPQEYPGKPGT